MLLFGYQAVPVLFEERTEFRMIGNKSVRFHNKFVLVNKIEIFDSCTYIVGTGNWVQRYTFATVFKTI